MCFNGEKRIERIGRGQLSVMASRFLLLSPSSPDCGPASRDRFAARRRVESICGANLEAQTGHDGS
jgi:hypothetical protein